MNRAVVWVGLAALMALLFMGAKKMLPVSGKNLIKKWEGWSPVPYKDVAGLWTIGYGHLILPGESFTRITEVQGDALLEADMARTWNGIRAGFRRTPTENQRAAFLCFAYNVGASAFLNSTMLRKFNAGDVAGAAGEFDRWNKARDPKTGELVPVKGLTNRRSEEKAIFLTA
jgi:lysozyme